jgi:hypothetical protein
MEVVEEPLSGGRDEGAFADILRQLAIGGIERARVVAETGKNAAGVTLLRVDSQVRRERERPLIEPL